MCHRVQTTMRCEAAAVPAARHWTDQRLNQMYAKPGETVHDAALVVSELVSNCVRADAHYFDLTLNGHHDNVRVEATDDAPGQPVMRDAAPGDVDGRGLLIVDSLTDGWGVEPTQRGKTVWAELAMTPDCAATFGCSRPAPDAA